MAQYLDKTGLAYLWGKITDHVSSAVSSKQDTLVSVTNIKTINSQSLLGSGNISIDLTLYKVVTELPTSSIDTTKIYLVKSDTAGTNDTYTEYMYVNSAWEKLGEYQASVDLSNYITDLSVSGKVITYIKGDGSTGTITTQDTDTTYSVMTGATSSASGKQGLVPAPAAGKNTAFLRGDGTWAVPTDTTYSAATASVAGLMSAADKTKLDAIQADADAVSFTQSLTSGTAVGTLTINGTATTLYAPANTDTHYTTYLYAGSGSAANAATSNGSTKLTVADNSTVRSSVTIKGSGATTVASDASGIVTITSTNTTYSAATTSAAGLMSASDKSKLDAITASADSVSVTQTLTSGTEVGKVTVNGTATTLYAPTNTDTHYTTGLITGASSTATANAAASNGSVYLNVLDNSNVRNSHNIVGSGATTVVCDANGKITISSTNTTYSAATTSAAGLMSASDKSKLDAITSAATADSALTTSDIDDACS